MRYEITLIKLPHVSPGEVDEKFGDLAPELSLGVLKKALADKVAANSGIAWGKRKRRMDEVQARIARWGGRSKLTDRAGTVERLLSDIGGAIERQAAKLVPSLSEEYREEDLRKEQLAGRPEAVGDAGSREMLSFGLVVVVAFVLHVVHATIDDLGDKSLDVWGAIPSNFLMICAGAGAAWAVRAGWRAWRSPQTSRAKVAQLLALPAVGVIGALVALATAEGTREPARAKSSTPVESPAVEVARVAETSQGGAAPEKEDVRAREASGEVEGVGRPDGGVPTEALLQLVNEHLEKRKRAREAKLAAPAATVTVDEGTAGAPSHATAPGGGAPAVAPVSAVPSASPDPAPPPVAGAGPVVVAATSMAGTGPTTLTNAAGNAAPERLLSSEAPALAATPQTPPTTSARPLPEPSAVVKAASPPKLESKPLALGRSSPAGSAAPLEPTDTLLHTLRELRFLALMGALWLVTVVVMAFYYNRHLKRERQLVSKLTEMLESREGDGELASAEAQENEPIENAEGGVGEESDELQPEKAAFDDLALPSVPPDASGLDAAPTEDDGEWGEAGDFEVGEADLGDDGGPVSSAPSSELTVSSGELEAVEPAGESLAPAASALSPLDDFDALGRLDEATGDVLPDVVDDPFAGPGDPRAPDSSEGLGNADTAFAFGEPGASLPSLTSSGSMSPTRESALESVIDELAELRRRVEEADARDEVKGAREVQELRAQMGTLTEELAEARRQLEKVVAARLPPPAVNPLPRPAVPPNVEPAPPPQPANDAGQPRVRTKRTSYAVTNLQEEVVSIPFRRKR